MIINKISFENPVFIVFYQQLLASIIYVNKNIAKAQPEFRTQVKVNQPYYYTLISMITRREVQKLGGKYLTKLIFHIRIEVGLFEISNLPNFNKS